MSGIDQLLNALLKWAGLDPEATRKHVAELGQIVVELKAQLDRIENKLDISLRPDTDQPLIEDRDHHGRPRQNN